MFKKTKHGYDTIKMRSVSIFRFFKSAINN